MGSLKVARYARLHSLGAGASAGGPEGPGSASLINWHSYSFAVSLMVDLLDRLMCLG